MIKKMIVAGLMLLFLITFSSAVVENLGVFKHNTCVNLLQSCSNCSFNNISSVIYPNSSNALGQVTMTKIGQVYNYSFCNNRLLGDYIVNGFGDPDGQRTVWAYSYKVTPTGDERNEQFIYILFGTGIILLIFGLWIKVPILGTFSGFVIMASGVYVLIYGFLNFNDTYTRILGFSGIALGLFLTIVSTYEWIQE